MTYTVARIHEGLDLKASIVVHMAAPKLIKQLVQEGLPDLDHSDTPEDADCFSYSDFGHEVLIYVSTPDAVEEWAAFLESLTPTTNSVVPMEYIDSLKASGGRLWEGGGHARIYMPLDKAFTLAGGTTTYIRKRLAAASLPGVRLTGMRPALLPESVSLDLLTGIWSLTGEPDIDTVLLKALEALR